MIDVSATTIDAKNQLHPSGSGALAWVQLWDIQIDDTNLYRITSNNEAITMDGNSYTPFNIGRTEITEDTEGTVQNLSVSVTNVDRVVQGYLEAGKLIGKSVTLYIIPIDSGSAGSYSSEEAVAISLKIQNVTADELAVTFELGQVNLFDQPFPRNRFIRSTCTKKYGSAECGYDTTRSGALATCSKKIDGSNGCIAHGDDEVAAGLPRLHPLLYGGFKGILAGRIA